MTNFNDLPKPVREQIYRLHLEHRKPISSEKHKRLVKQKSGGPRRFMPPILTLSTRIEKEAAPFYYSNNNFCFDGYGQVWAMRNHTWPRHQRLIRTVTFSWHNDRYPCYSSGEEFNQLGLLHGLQSLYIRVDERAMIQKMWWRDSMHSRIPVSDPPTPQQQLLIYQYPGMSALLRLSGIPNVKFTELTDERGRQKPNTGPISGGLLEVEVTKRITAAKSANHCIGDAGTFDFLALSPELRNRVYDFAFQLRGPVQLSTRAPSSSPKKSTQQYGETSAPESVLGMLAVNRQIHDEAVGIFYHLNRLTFSHISHLHAFIQTIGPLRANSVRDIELHYADVRSGGISLAALTFPLLKTLQGLRRLHVVMSGDIANGRRGSYWGARYSLSKTSPAMIPGIKTLFELRGVADIKIRDPVLEERLAAAKKKAGYPNFGAYTSEQCTVQLHRALEHLNAALGDAQVGKVNRRLLEESDWHTRDAFPSLEEREASQEL